MGRWSILSVGLFVLPIGVTLGILFGLEAYRTSTGQAPLFTSNAVKTSTYCQLAFGITPDTNGQQFTLNPNQWGVTSQTPGNGALCMNVTTYDNNTYPTNNSAPEFSITWQFPQGPQTQPVHAFSNVKLDSDSMPLQINTVKNIDIDVEWTYGVGDKAAKTIDQAALTQVELNSNVAIDMFLDPDSSHATSTENAKYEVMVWLATFGPATQPIGLAQGALSTQTVNGTTFNLYFGVNGLQQTVLTWVAASTAANFEGDISPLLQGLDAHGGPAATDYLGYVAFGSEALWSLSNVTLSVPTLQMSVTKK